jgi:hypothetical protein
MLRVPGPNYGLIKIERAAKKASLEDLQEQRFFLAACFVEKIGEVISNWIGSRENLKSQMGQYATMISISKIDYF